MGKIKKIYKNICLNEWELKEIQHLKTNDENVNKKFDEILYKLSEIEKNSNELVYANIFHDTIKNSEWLDIPLSLTRWSIGYNFAYILYRVLDDVKPKSILELGLGQSTKIINEYAKHHDSINHNIVEHNKDWVNFFKKNNDMSNMVNFHLLNNYKREYNGVKFNAYKNFKKEFENKKFDLIVIDAPVGGTEYSRMDILDIIPNCLNKSFIILLDDCERIGEQHTIEMLESKLAKNNIIYTTGYLNKGITNAYICTSSDLSFLCSI